jgi:AraC-like DNA-binding protein|tara:strand:+ start:731 stop:1705 length:975 start_codon:yes stop_codon:yes gene_type:complete
MPVSCRQTAEPVVTEAAFSEVSGAFCSSYARVQSSPSEKSQQGALFEGELSLRSFSSGILLSTAKIRSIQGSQHAAVIPKSLCLAMTFDAPSCEFRPSGGAGQILDKGELGFFAYSDSVELESHYRSGHRNTSLLLQLKDDTLADPQLADYVAKLTSSSQSSVLGHDPNLLKLALQILRFENVGVVGALRAESQILELLARAFTGHENLAVAAYRQAEMRKIFRVRDLLEEYPEYSHTLSSLAQEVGLSVSSLKGKFRATFGMPIYQYLKEVRMKRAKIGLTEEGWSVQQAAYFSGFQHPANFSTAFKKHFGQSPSEFNPPDFD